MNQKEAIEAIKQNFLQEVEDLIKRSVNLKLEAGEYCPFCGRKKGSRKVSEKMLAANRRNIKLAQERRNKGANDGETLPNGGTAEANSGVAAI